MRRGVGLGAIQQRLKEKAAAEVKGTELTAERIKHVEEQLSSFRVHLEEFASKHRAEINKDPEFRRAFAKMTKSIGVDPLASSKGFWSTITGVGDFYYELSVQVVDICLHTRSTNGGLISLNELTQRLNRMRGGHSAAVASTRSSAGATVSGAAAAVSGAGAASSRGRKHEAISLDDVKRAVDKLAVLGGGYRLVSLSGEQYLLSVPVEMNVDHTLLLQRVSAAAAAAPVTLPTAGAFSCAHATAEALRRELGWDASRVRRSLDTLLKEGMAWVDAQAPETAAEGPRYYFPAILTGAPVSAASAGAGASTAS
jgi:ESCRT-II complex subunit VPS22